MRNDDSDIVDEIEEFIDELLESHERFTLGGSSKYRLQYFGMSSLAESLVYAWINLFHGFKSSDMSPLVLRTNKHGNEMTTFISSLFQAGLFRKFYSATSKLKH